MEGASEERPSRSEPWTASQCVPETHPRPFVNPQVIAPNVRTFAVRGKSDDDVKAQASEFGVALTVDELRRIADHLQRDPTMVEVHAFDAQWSEHCSYKSSRAFLSRLPTEGPSVVLGPGEDAGIVHLGEWEGERYGIVVAHESHNHPSQVVPFEGAATGIGGIVRDVLCMGARVIAVADPLRFGPLDDPHCRYVAQGVVDGIAAYGNAIGVPNVGGSVYFHEGFRDNCLVNVVALGIVNERDIIHSRAPAGSDGWDIVLVGKATDRSGFGGAAFSSLVLDEEDAEANKGAVQVPDPFLKSVIMRASYRAFDVVKEEKLTVGFKDLGAGGIMGCTAELVASGGFGAVIDLDRCPTSQAGLDPSVIAVGETQERLCWVVPPHFTSRLLAIYNEEFGLPDIAQGARAAIIGSVSASRDYVLRWHGEEVMRVPIDFLTGGIRYDRRYFDYPRRLQDAYQVAATGNPASLGAALERVLAHLDVCSRHAIFERYDSVVRGTTSIAAGYADAGVIVPVPGAPLGVALGIGGNPRYGLLSPERAGQLAVLEAVRNVVAVGARPAALTDCLNFGNPEVAEQMSDFVMAIDGLAKAGRKLRVPFVSGNVSLYNQSASGNAIPASPIVACIGTVGDVSRTVTPDLKRVGSALYIVGKRDVSALAGSVFAAVNSFQGGVARVPDLDAVVDEVQVVLSAIDRGLILSCHDVSDGGLLAAIAEMCFAALPQRALGVHFEEDISQSRAFSEAGAFIVEIGDAAAFERHCAESGLEVSCSMASSGLAGPLAHGDEARWEQDFNVKRIGHTSDRAVLASPSGMIGDVRSLHEIWSAPLANFFGDVA